MREKIAEIEPMHPILRLIFALAIALIWPVLSFSQKDGIVVKVSVEETGYGETSLGGGVFFGVNDGKAQIVTAAHVIMGEDSGQAFTRDTYLSGRATLNITFRNGETVLGTLRHIDTEYLNSYGDAGVDLAILEVPATENIAELFRDSKNVLANDGVALLNGDGVTSIGFSGGVMWSTQRRPTPVTGMNEGNYVDICFDPGTITQGQSGGAVFDEFGALRGLVLKISPSCGPESSRAPQRVTKAISWKSVQKYLTELGYQTGLSINQEFLPTIAEHTLDVLRLDSNRDIEAALLNTEISLEALSLYWISGYDARRFEELLLSPAAGSTAPFYDVWIRRLMSKDCILVDADNPRVRQIAAAADVKSGSSCNPGIASWFGHMIDEGVDPNFVLRRPKTPTVEDGSLLSGAFRGGAADLTIVLLEKGAYPNPYFDLGGRSGWKNSFVDPLWAVPRLFQPEDHDRVYNALEAAGVVVFRDQTGARASSFAFSKSLRETETDRVCLHASERDHFDWCARVRQTDNIKFSSVVITEWSDAFGEHTAGLAHTLFISPNAAFVLAWLPGKNIDRAEAIVVQIPREGEAWFAYWHDDYSRCRERPDGTSPSLCWREYDAEPAALRVSVPDTLPTGSNTVSAFNQNWAIEGLSLETKTGEAIKALIANGYEAQRVGDYRDGPGMFLTMPYQKNVQGGYSTVTLNTVDENIFIITRSSRGDLISDQIVQRIEESDEFELQSKWLFNGLRSSALSQAAVQSAQDQDFGVVISATGRSDAFDRETITLYRRPTGAGSELSSLIDGHLLELFTTIRSGNDGSSCIDNYVIIRARPAGCVTLEDFETNFLATNGARYGVETLPSGVQYEVTSRVSDEPLSPEESYYGLYTHGVIENLGESLSRGGRFFKIGEGYPSAINEVLPLLRKKDDVTIYIPSDVRRRTDDIDLLATTVFTIRFSGRNGILP